MLEYCHEATLIIVSTSFEDAMCQWCESPEPGKYLELLRTARLLEYCPTQTTNKLQHFLAAMFQCNDGILWELGLDSFSTSYLDIWRTLKTYLNRPLNFRSCRYCYEGEYYSLSGEITARFLWNQLSNHSTLVLATVDPKTLILHCRQRF